MHSRGTEGVSLAKLGLVDIVEAEQTVHRLLTEGTRRLKHKRDCAKASGVRCLAVVADLILGPGGGSDKPNRSGPGEEMLLHGVDDRDVKHGRLAWQWEVLDQ